MKRRITTPERAGFPSVFRYTDARTAGISAERLYSYWNLGLVRQLGRGLYQRAGAPEGDQDLLEIAHRAPRSTLCLVTALARHGLTDIIPARIDVAIPRGNRVPTLCSLTDIHVFARSTFNLGREKRDIGDGSSVSGGAGFSDRGISGIRAGSNRRSEVHEEAQTEPFRSI